MRSSLAAAIFGVALLLPLPAAAERVVLLRPPRDDALLVDAWHRLEAELHIHEFTTEVVEPKDGTAPARAVADAAERSAAFAAIALIHRDDSASVEVWLVDRATGKTTMRTIDVQNGADASSVLAIRAVDLLRASLREFSAGARPPVDVMGVERRKVDAAVDRFVAPPEPSVHVRADALLLVEAGLGVAAGPALGISYRVLDALELGVGAAGPLLGAHLDTALGSATTHQEEAWGELRVRLFRRSLLSAGLQVGAGAHFLTAQGEPHPPLRAREETVVAFLAIAGAHLDIALSRTLAVGVALSATATAPRLGVAVDRETSAVGVPMFAASAGIRVGL
jgi:hypothetical protein